MATSAKHYYYHLNIYTISSLIMNLGPSEKMGYLETFYPNKKSLSMGTINEASSVCLRPVLILIKIVSLIRGMVPALSSHNGHITRIIFKFFDSDNAMSSFNDHSQKISPPM